MKDLEAYSINDLKNEIEKLLKENLNETNVAYIANFLTAMYEYIDMRKEYNDIPKDKIQRENQDNAKAVKNNIEEILLKFIQQKGIVVLLNEGVSDKIIPIAHKQCEKLECKEDFEQIFKEKEKIKKRVEKQKENIELENIEFSL